MHLAEQTAESSSGVCVPADCGAGAMPVALEQAPLFDQFDSL